LADQNSHRGGRMKMSMVSLTWWWRNNIKCEKWRKENTNGRSWVRKISKIECAIHEQLLAIREICRHLLINDVVFKQPILTPRMSTVHKKERYVNEMWMMCLWCAVYCGVMYLIILYISYCLHYLSKYCLSYSMITMYIAKRCYLSGIVTMNIIIVSLFIEKDRDMEKEAS
jgi:hypothetical protein